MTSFSAGTALAVIISFLSVTFAYACPGLAFMRLSGFSYSATPHKIKANPCHHEKRDICQSVRDQLLSLQASSLQIASSDAYPIADFSFSAASLEAGRYQPGYGARESLILLLCKLKPFYSRYSTVLII